MAKDVGALQRVLLEASTEEKTVILTTLNQAWAEPNSTVLFWSSDITYSSRPITYSSSILGSRLPGHLRPLQRKH
ncbi:BnaAnng19470D [Brassica napus]|uniref:(rape) hypothetical protein n=1 Tax=Brassica napus TaxID=3708 RepID=A0A078JAQ5_BRANA|nr:unnamed protein product [Brassica napus]CDY64643.1 BnaAnng19470D [Brassica napus]